MHHVVHKLTGVLHRTPSDEEVAAYLQEYHRKKVEQAKQEGKKLSDSIEAVTLEDVKDVKTFATVTASLNTKVGEGSDELGDFMIGGDGDEVHENSEVEDLKTITRNALRRLRQRDGGKYAKHATVVELRMGLVRDEDGSSVELTLEEAAKALGKGSKEGVRQIEKKALELLREDQKYMAAIEDYQAGL